MARRGRDERRDAWSLAWLLAAVAAAVGGFALWKDHTVRAGLLFGAALLPPIAARWAYPGWVRVLRGWMALGHALSIVSSTVVLVLAWCLVFTPVAIVMRLSGRDALALKWSRRKPSYWIDRPEGTYTVDRYKSSF